MVTSIERKTGNVSVIADTKIIASGGMDAKHPVCGQQTLPGCEFPEN
jgi:hypothetical protein